MIVSFAVNLWDAAGAVFGTESVFNVSGETIRTVSIGFCTSRLSAGVSITLRFLSFLLFAAAARR